MAAISLPSYTEATGLPATRSCGSRQTSIPAPTGALLSSSSLSIHFHQSTTFAFPGDPHNPTQATGVVRLILTAKKSLKSIVIAFHGTMTVLSSKQGFITFPAPYAQEISLPLPFHPNSKGDSTELPPGTYDLPFTFVLPPHLPPVTRTKFGRIAYFATAKAKGAGRFGGTVEVQVPFDLTVVPCRMADARDDMRFDTEIQDLSPVLGPYRIHLFSPLLCVSGLLYAKLFLPSPAVPVTIHSIRLYVVQHFRLRLPSSGHANPSFTEEGANVEVPAPQKVLIALIDHAHPPDKTRSPALYRSSSQETPQGTPITDEPVGGHQRRQYDMTDANVTGKGELIRLEAGEPWQIDHVARVSCDDFLRGTTHPNTQTPLHLRHDLHLEIVYTPDSPSTGPDSAGRPEVNGLGDEGKKVLGVKKPLTLASCCCHTASLFLPTYEENDPNEHARLLAGLMRADRCICEEETEDLRRDQRSDAISFFADDPSFAGGQGHVNGGLTNGYAGTNGVANGTAEPAWLGKV